MCDKLKLDEITKIIIARLKQIFKNKLKDVILFGSYARGNFDEDSDIDIFVLVDMDDLELNNFIPVVTDATFDLDLKYNTTISIILKSLDHFELWKDTLPFYRNVLNEGVKMSA